jgi:hypothetical protein
MGFEAIMQHRKLEIPTKKGWMTLAQFEQMPNAAKTPQSKSNRVRFVMLCN